LSTPVLKASSVYEYTPAGAKYEATYVVFAAIVTGDEKLTCCQPEADSPVNVADASNVPVELHRLPRCVPVLPAAL
jgi:hypothetical protein